jgi:hypothetical protein
MTCYGSTSYQPTSNKFRFFLEILALYIRCKTSRADVGAVTGVVGLDTGSDGCAARSEGYPLLQQRTKLKQDLKAGLSDLLIQLDLIESKYFDYSPTPLAISDKLPSERMPSYAVENLTNLLDGIDRELVS